MMRKLSVESKDYKDFMIFTGIIKQPLGRLYRCPKCERKFWSAWGWARRHYENETLRKNQKEKTCSKCNLEKPLVMFDKNKNSPDGHRSWCKDCVARYHKIWIGRPNSREHLRENDRRWRKNNLQHCRELDVRQRKKLRLIVLQKVSGQENPYCVGCNCDDLRLLEVNHKNGGGSKELKKGKDARRFYLDIKYGGRSTDDLNVLCRVCNNRDYLERKYGESLPYKIMWGGTTD